MQAAQNERTYYKKLADDLGERADKRGREAADLRTQLLSAQQREKQLEIGLDRHSRNADQLCRELAVSKGQATYWNEQCVEARQLIDIYAARTVSDMHDKGQV